MDARTPMVLSVLATIAAMIAKELAGILVVIFMPRHAYADVLDVAADSIISALYLMYRVIQDCFRPVGLRAAIVDPTGKHTKPLIPMEHFIPKITMLWKVLVVVEVLAEMQVRKLAPRSTSASLLRPRLPLPLSLLSSALRLMNFAKGDAYA